MTEKKEGKTMTVLFFPRLFLGAGFILCHGVLFPRQEEDKRKERTTGSHHKEENESCWPDEETFAQQLFSSFMIVGSGTSYRRLLFLYPAVVS